MAFTYGFYDAVLQGGEYDRVYSASQFSQIFDGIIQDGVYATIGNKFAVTPDNNTNMRVFVGSGRAWFEHTWTYNDSSYPVTLEAPDSNRPRIDAIVLRIDATNRINEFTYITGTPRASNPAKPTIPEHYYPLAYVTVTAGASHLISAAQIENAVGVDPKTPYVTGRIEVTSAEELYAQWEALWEAWFNDTQTNSTTLLANLQTEIDEIDASSNFDLPPIVGYNIDIQASSWITYTPTSNTEEYKIHSKGYIYRTMIPLPGVLAGMRPYITWSLPSLDDAGAEVLNQCQCVTDGVYAYAAARPSSTVTVLTVECRRNSID